MQRDIHRDAAIERGVGNVLVKERLEHDDFVPGLQERGLKRVNALVCARCDDNFGRRVEFTLERGCFVRVSDVFSFTYTGNLQ